MLLSEQLAAVRLHKLTPPEYAPKIGQLEYEFANNQQVEEMKKGVRFIPSKTGKVEIGRAHV